MLFEGSLYLRRGVLILCLWVSSLFVVEPVSSQNLEYRGLGFRGGVTVDPDQIHLGFHTDLGEFVRNLRFQPNVEVGLGDDLTLIALNLESIYLFRGGGTVIPYVGGGLGINFFNDRETSLREDDDVEVGLNVLAGLETFVGRDQKFFGEIKLGAGDSPDFKLTLGITFLAR